MASPQIAAALADHEGRVTAVVPHYAMSGATLIALAADEIVLDRHAALGPVDPRLGECPAASIVEAVDRPGDHEDKTLIMADVGRKALAQVEGSSHGCVSGACRGTGRARPRMCWPPACGPTITGCRVPELTALGLPLRVGVPVLERDLMTLYPQPRCRTPAVEYVAGPPGPSLPRRRGGPHAPAKLRPAPVGSRLRR
jgi:hypothetical protein